MKNLLIISILSLSIISACKRDKLRNLNEKASSINPNDMESVLNSLGYGYDALLHISASNGITQPGGNCKAQFYNPNNSLVSVGSLTVNSENVPKLTGNAYDISQRYYSSGGSFNPLSAIQSMMGQSIQINLAGDTFGYPSYDTVAAMPPMIVGANFTSTTSRQITSTSSIPLTWTGGSSNDEYMFLELRWLKKSSNLGSSYISSYGVWIDDNGSYTIPNSVVSQFDPSGDIMIYLHRYRAYEFNVNGRTFVVIGQASRAFGAFYY